MVQISEFTSLLFNSPEAGEQSGKSQFQEVIQGSRFLLSGIPPTPRALLSSALLKLAQRPRSGLTHGKVRERVQGNQLL